MKTFLLSLFIGITSIQLNAQTSNILQVNEAETPIELETLDIKVSVIGNVAQTVIKMTFYNPNDRVLEGELNFPISEGQQVFRFAMDINGKLREAVVVEKNLGKQVFEGVVRQVIDPALLEKTTGNNYRARVYPIPQKGRKTILIGYEEELNSKFPIYQLISEFGKVDEFQIKVEVVNKEVTPVIREHELLNLEFQKWRSSYLAEFTRNNFEANGVLSFEVPANNDKTIFRQKTDTKDDYFYITANITPDKEPKVLPKSITILWDVSKSLSGRNISKELDFLRYYLNKLSNVEITLLTFSNKVHERKNYSISNGNSQALIEDLNRMIYDGATSYRSIPFSGINTDEILFFTDGLVNLDDQKNLPITVPTYVVSSSSSIDSEKLNRIAQKTEGRFINLINTTTKDALNELLTKPYYFFGVEYDSSVIDDVHPKDIYIIKPGADFTLAGKIKEGKNTSIILNFGANGEITEQRQIVISEELTNQNLERIWAAKKLVSLQQNRPDEKQYITDFAKKFNLITTYTSLIILDRVEDYVEYEIEPPSELKSEYDLLLASKKKTKRVTEIGIIESLLNDYSETINWWKNDERDNNKVSNNERNRAPALAEEVQLHESRAVSEEVVVSGIFGAESIDLDASITTEVVAYSVSSTTQSAPSNTPLFENPTELKLSVAEWSGSEPYIVSLANTPKEQRYNKYLNLRDEYGTAPSFYFLSGTYLIDNNQIDEGLRILSNIAELELENHELLKILANTYLELGQYDTSIFLFKKILEIRSFEPQSKRDLALAYSANGEYQKAIDLMNEILTTDFTEEIHDPLLKMTILQEMNNIISKTDTLDLSDIDKDLIIDLPVDIRIVLNWNTVDTDLDLWVTEPTGEKCYYQNELTRIGGKLTYDNVSGYGPEEYLLKTATPGEYTIEVDFYDDRVQKVSGPVTVHVSVFWNYGSENQQEKKYTRQLKDAKDVIEIGSFIWE